MKHTLLVGGDGRSILDVALDDGIDVPHDCKMGVCLTCPAKLVSGELEQSPSVLNDDAIAKARNLLVTKG